LMLCSSQKILSSLSMYNPQTFIAHYSYVIGCHSNESLQTSIHPQLLYDDDRQNYPAYRQEQMVVPVTFLLTCPKESSLTMDAF
jgi:hypothetical protein